MGTVLPFGMFWFLCLPASGQVTQIAAESLIQDICPSCSRGASGDLLSGISAALMFCLDSLCLSPLFFWREWKPCAALFQFGKLFGFVTNILAWQGVFYSSNYFGVFLVGRGQRERSRKGEGAYLSGFVARIPAWKRVFYSSISFRHIFLVALTKFTWGGGVIFLPPFRSTSFFFFLQYDKEKAPTHFLQYD